MIKCFSVIAFEYSVKKISGLVPLFFLFRRTFLQRFCKPWRCRMTISLPIASLPSHTNFPRESTETLDLRGKFMVECKNKEPPH